MSGHSPALLLLEIMTWESISQPMKDLMFAAPGGMSLGYELFGKLRISAGSRVLDLTPGNGIAGAVAAKQFKCRVHMLAENDRQTEEIPALAAGFDIDHQVEITTGNPASMPFPSDHFGSVYSIAFPTGVSLTPVIVRELYRVTEPGGFVGLAGPAGLKNETPPHMETALRTMRSGNLKTPALTALKLAYGGFHIISAEYMADSYSHWLEWLNSAPKDLITDIFRRAVIEDNGNWLALGLVIVKKPLKPDWAL